MIHLYIGDGKGKTSAALGLAIRARGWGQKVYVAQFLKDAKAPSGEMRMSKKRKPVIVIERFKDQVHPLFQGKRKIAKQKMRASIKKALQKIEGYIDQNTFDVIVLDEIANCIAAGYIDSASVERIVKRAKHIEWVLTGRSAPKSLQKCADYVSYIKKIAHPFDKRVRARKGIEY